LAKTRVAKKRVAKEWADIELMAMGKPTAAQLIVKRRIAKALTGFSYPLLR
jgi:hypothetical protein